MFYIVSYGVEKQSLKGIRHCCRSSAGRYISTISVYNLFKHRTSIDLIKDNGFTLKKDRSRRYPAETRTDANNTDDITLLANTPPSAESLLHNLEQAAGGIGLHVIK